MNEELKNNIWTLGSGAILVFGALLVFLGSSGEFLPWIGWFISVLGAVGLGYISGFDEAFKRNI